jgi:hypothetical protein
MAKHAFIITAAPGVGKTTIMSHLLHKLPDDSAMIDGDELGRIHPWSLSIEWLNLIQDNIVKCAENFRNYGKKYFVTTFCLPTQERLERLTMKLSALGYQVHSFALIVSNENLEKRHIERNEDKQLNYEDFDESQKCNNAIRKLTRVHFIDINDVTAEESAFIISNKISELISSK